ELNGSASGVLDMASLAAHYDYMFLPAGTGAITSTVKFYINGSLVGSGSGGDNVAGNVVLSGWTMGAAATDWEVRIDATVTGATNDVILDIPDHTIALTPPAPVATVP